MCLKMRTHRIFASVTGGLASALVTVGVASKIALTMAARQKAMFFIGRYLIPFFYCEVGLTGSLSNRACGFPAHGLPMVSTARLARVAHGSPQMMQAHAEETLEGHFATRKRVRCPPRRQSQLHRRWWT